MVMQIWSSWHQMAHDLTEFIKAMAPIAVAYLTYNFRKEPSPKQKREKKNHHEN